jgi:hypothetical protein
MVVGRYGIVGTGHAYRIWKGDVRARTSPRLSCGTPFFHVLVFLLTVESLLPPEAATRKGGEAELIPRCQPRDLGA